ncbi:MULTISPECIES: efflux RND transporter permease subunit [unclassified Cryobacterium]|uniref:efflux RND transporter permease subunit n=1 Tax=unclassified Cryobacterium TaxID=2649013 RepID=UPI00106A6039|nr:MULTISPECIES: efflux RND transporter permease subunit [unclassified Cryobacterium]TFB93730.1 AcrB/AcrD/AcrF family protein [Cryobacterium sp. MDB2-A-1]TFC09058.1 AcrB/AcrD/AcrF family protein [Cryobacterium sp. MDB2-33-2]TFC14296.1 AcrB/AcrD/AcrF family protein [Cryobacterium sp. MDB2-10]TFC14838.1 AcrB/AcrD/AcrF family protein [Cryobacterium sp. MDB2-A-2]
MHFLAVLSMKNRALIALITIVAAIFGSLALTSLKQELIPSLQLPQLLVSTSYPGASPEVVNDDVSTPIETAIQGIAGLESTSTTSSTNSSLVSATFTYGTDLVKAESRISQAINRIKTRLPDNLDPQVISGSIDDFPVISLAVSGGDQATLADDLKRSVLGDIRDVSGVREAALVGDVGRRVTITADAAALAARGLSTQAIRSALQQNGALIPAGSLTEGDKTLSVQAGGKLTSAADIAALPLLATGAGTAPGAAPATPPTIGDVATVVLGENPVASISRVNGQPALTIAVTKVPAANTVDVSTAVRAILPRLQDAVPGTTFTVVFDQAPFIQESINSLTQEGILGLVFAVLVILVFLLSVRATLVTAISIPTSVLITFIGLQGVGYSLNILTLGALTIAIGRVVDDSIVVIENIKRHLVPGVDRSETIVAAVREVAGAITASTITTVTVFLPIAFVGGSTGELFRPFALTVTIALLASLLVSLTIVPVLAYWFLRAPSPRPARTPKPAKPTKPAKAPNSAQPGKAPETAPVLVTTDAAAFAVADPTGPGALAAESAQTTTVADAAADHPGGSAPAAAPATPTAAAAASRRTRRAASAPADAIVEEPSRLQTGYLPIIRWTLRHAVATLLLSVLVLGGTVAIIPFMKVNFLGSTGQTTFRVAQALPVGTSLAAQDTASTAVESALRGTPGVKIIQVSIGGGSALAAFAGGAPTTSTVTYSITTDGVAKPDAVQDAVRGKLAALTGVGDFSVTAGGGFGGTSDIAVDITAANGADLQTASDSILAAVKKLDAIKESSSNLAASRPYLAVTIDRTKAAAAGLSELALGTLVSQAMQPSVVGSIVINEANLSVYLTGASSPATTAELAALPIPTLAGPVALSTLATVAQVDGPATLTTTKGLRTATVSATPNNNDLGTANAQMATVLADTTLPTGATATLGGVTKDQTDAFQQLGIALLAAILIVYIVMVATFRSLLQPLLLLVSIPFAATGAIALQVITGIPLGVPSLIGVLMLIGIVVTNAIVLIDLVNQYRRRGLDVREALVNGASRRLRPILMTALATIFALLPMAVGLTGTGGFISQPLALVVIGGLVSSTLLTLIVLPVLYFLVEGGRERRAVRREEKNAARAASAADAVTSLG